MTDKSRLEMVRDIGRKLSPRKRQMIKRQIATLGGGHKKKKPLKQIEEHLLAYQQADEDGVMVLVSRQALHEAAAEITRLRERLKEADQLIKDWTDDGIIEGAEE